MLLEAIERHRDRVQARTDERVEALARESHTVGNHTPRVATTVEVDAYLFEVLAHKHLAARQDYKHLVGVYVGCYLIVEYTKKILGGHIAQRCIDAAVATAVAALQVTAQRTLPKEGVERMLLLVYLMQSFE